MTKPTFTSFEEFWSYYLGEHRTRACRVMHYVGAFASLAVVVRAMWCSEWLLLGLAPSVGYAFAWLGHLVFEHNRPATWGWVGWSLRGEARMLARAFTGRLRADLVCRGQP